MKTGELGVCCDWCGGSDEVEVCSIGLALCEGCSEAFDASVQAKRELVRSALRDTLPAPAGVWLAPADMDQSPSWEALALLESGETTPGTDEDL